MQIYCTWCHNHLGIAALLYCTGSPLCRLTCLYSCIHYADRPEQLRSVTQRLGSCCLTNARFNVLTASARFSAADSAPSAAISHVVSGINLQDVVQTLFAVQKSVIVLHESVEKVHATQARIEINVQETKAMQANMLKRIRYVLGCAACAALGWKLHMQHVVAACCYAICAQVRCCMHPAVLSLPAAQHTSTTCTACQHFMHYNASCCPLAPLQCLAPPPPLTPPNPPLHTPPYPSTLKAQHWHSPHIPCPHRNGRTREFTQPLEELVREKAAAAPQEANNAAAKVADVGVLPSDQGVYFPTARGDAFTLTQAELAALATFYGDDLGIQEADTLRCRQDKFLAFITA